MRRTYIIAAAIALTGMTSNIPPSLVPDVVHATASGTTDWPEYMHDITGSGYTSDTGITAQNASTLALRAGWPVRTVNGAMITAQPIESGGYLYWGSWDGFEHGTPVNGGPGAWETSLGTLTYPPTTACAKSGVHGVGDSGVVVSGLTIQGDTDPVLFVAGGGNDSVGAGSASMYALDALTGSVLWQQPIAPSPDDYLWSSPLLFQVPGQTDPSIYEGVADVGEPCPLVQGEVVRLDAVTGAILNTFPTAPSGCKGATVWGSLTLDAGASPPAVYAVTGNNGPCKAKEPYAFAIVKLDANDRNVLDSWQLPKALRVGSDDDFGSVPILFQDSLGTMFVGAVNKNGTFYIWNRNDLAAGPVYSLAVANHNVADIAPAAFDGTVLYIGTPATTVTVNGVPVRQSGSIQAYNVNNLNNFNPPTPLWETKLTAPVIASVTAANVGPAEIVVVNAGHKTLIINASTGAIVKTLQAESVDGTRGFFWGAPIIANGVLYEGDTQGFLYAYSPGGL